MTKCTIAPAVVENPFSQALYLRLIQGRVSCEELDQGYAFLNLNGKKCPQATDQYCLQGKGDGIVQPIEVTSYVLNRYERYQKFIEQVVKRPLPWTFDDQDPGTSFDAKVRAQVQGAIAQAKLLLNKNGIPEGSEAYQERLAVALFYFAATPQVLAGYKLTGVPTKLTQELTSLGLQEFQKFLFEKGGLGIEFVYSQEKTALEALKTKKGDSTEQSHILYAVFKMAGLDPSFIEVRRNELNLQDAELRKLLNASPPWYQHICIGLNLNKKLRLFDLTLFNSNASHRTYYPLTLRHYLSRYLFNNGVDWAANGRMDEARRSFDFAMAVDPENPHTYTNQGRLLAQEGKLDRALYNFQKAIELDPQEAFAYYHQGKLLLENGDLEHAFVNFSKAVEIDPSLIDAQLLLSQTLIGMDREAIALEFLDNVIQMRPQLGKAYTLRAFARLGASLSDQKDRLQKAEEDFKQAALLDPELREYWRAFGLTFIRKGRIPEGVPVLAQFFKIFPEETATFFQPLKQFVQLYWANTPSGLELREVIGRETAGMDVIEIETAFVYSYILWEAGLQQEALKSFSEITITLSALNKRLKKTKEWIDNLLDLMPLSMKQDFKVSQLTQSLKDRLRTMGWD